jgi:colanic acid/amylovoran biosynthesis glycosyltransferase
MHIAYLINQYPKISHSFIRREILALERQGVTIYRIALRGWDADLVDPEDQLERRRTRYVLQDGALALIAAAFRIFVRQPKRFILAMAHVWRMARRSERPFAIHLIYLAEACRIRLWLSEARIDHLHAHFGTNSAEIAMLVHSLGGPSWSFTVHGPEEFDKSHQINLAEKIRQARFVVAISSYGRSQLYRLVEHQYWSKVQVVHCGLDRAFYEVPLTEGFRSRRFICVGRLCEQKAQLLLLEAAKGLAEKQVDFELVLAGDGEMRADIESFIANHKLQSIVRVTGWIDSASVRDEIQAARALVLPSFAEGLPVVIMEAMALSRPIISTYIAGIPELVHPPEHGWLVPAGDVSALVKAMLACLDASDQELKAMGAAACEQVLLSHIADKEASKLAELFKTAIEANLSKPSR